MLINFNHLKTFYNALVHKMKAFRGNWNQNDPTADDYIKNRPFYSEEGLVEVLPITTLTSDSVTLNFPLAVGQEYKIIFDDVEYTSVARLYDGYIMIGNNAVYEYDNGVETNTGEPFAMETNGSDTEAYFYIADSVSGSPTHTVQIFAQQEIIHPIDSKYLPDDIITADNIPDNIVTVDKLDEALSDNLVTSDDITDVVRYTYQSLTTAQKSQARANIGAGTSSFSGSYNDLTNKTHDCKITEFILPYVKNTVEYATPGVTKFAINDANANSVIAEGTKEAVNAGSIHHININYIEYIYRGEATFVYIAGQTINHDTTTCIAQMRVFGNASLITKYRDNLSSYFNDITGYEQFDDTGEDFCYILGVFDSYPYDTYLQRDVLYCVAINDTQFDKYLSTDNNRGYIYEYVTLDENYLPSTIARMSDIEENYVTKEELNTIDGVSYFDAGRIIEN